MEAESLQQHLTVCLSVCLPAACEAVRQAFLSKTRAQLHKRRCPTTEVSSDLLVSCLGPGVCAVETCVHTAGRMSGPLQPLYSLEQPGIWGWGSQGQAPGHLVISVSS